MQEKVKTNSVCTSKVEGDTLVITVVGVGVVRFDTTKPPENLRREAALRGWNQRLVNAAALSRDPETGKSATPQAKFEAVKGLADYYLNGATTWSPTTRASVRREPEPEAAVLQALAELKGVGVEEIRALAERQAAAAGVGVAVWVAKAGTSPKISARVAEIRAEALESGGDVLEGI